LESVITLPEAQPILTDIGDLLEALPVLAEIPAGPWKQTRGDPNIIAQVTIDQVLINNEPHFVKNLRGGHIISLAAIEKHVVIKITGNSMNASQPIPIEDGDYVLLRRQNTAQAGDIVVAKILDQTTRNPMTTIKRFLIDGHPLLKAESKDDQYGTLDDEFKIDGLAVAVFKPVYKTNSNNNLDPESS
jgi:SOS-response transcriptional repressor LexA